MQTPSVLLRAALAATLLATGAVAADDPRFDPANGRNLANYPPSVFFDHKRLKLAIDIPDIETAAFNGVATLTTAPIGTAQSSLTLNARKTMAFSKVTVDGRPAQFTHDNNLLTITFAKPIAADQTAVIEMTYRAERPTGSDSGLLWFKTRTRDNGDVTPAMVYSQGESDYNSYWFPCHDYPNERLSTELLVTVDSAYQVVSNGRLVGKVTGLKSFEGEIDAHTGEELKRVEKPERTQWHWLQEKPHSTYLVMLAIGKYDIVDVNEGKPGVPMPVYGPLGTGDELKKVFKNTPEMVSHFEKLFDEPYPWDKYAQVIVRNFRWGGMENTSATTLAEYAARGDEGSQDELISHELVHQWFGDLVTCKSWDHLWLNEGWATIGEWLWTQHTRGDDAYYRKAREALSALKLTRSESLPKGVGMVSRYYKEIDDNFSKAENPYTRGGFFLHMLRERLGEEVFWKGVRRYLDTYKLACAETGDFRKVMEEVSGQSLERFFDQWAFRPGMPSLKIETKYDDDSKKMIVTVEQTQKIDADNPAYALRVPVYCEFPVEEGKEQPPGRWLYIDIDTDSATQSFDLPMHPNRIRIDPNVSLLARINDRPRNNNSGGGEGQ